MNNDTFNIRCLSVRQPWAWLIANGHKAVENRTRYFRWRGTLYIHAASAMTEAEYMNCWTFSRERGVVLPERSALLFGGFVAKAKLTDCVRESTNRWFTGPYGLVLSEVEQTQFMAYSGRQGLFIFSCKDCCNPIPHTHCSECGSAAHLAARCDNGG